MKSILMICLMGISNLYLSKYNSGFREHMEKNANSIHGVWSESTNGTNSAKALKVIFFPGGKLNVIRKLHNYIGSYEVHNETGKYVDGTITIGNEYPFTATFLTTNKIKLVINYKDGPQTKYLIKTKKIKSGFQLIENAGKTESKTAKA